MLKLPHNSLISHASKVMLKILQARLQKYVNHKLPDVQVGFRKGRGTRNQIANICWIIGKSKRVPEKHLLLLYWLCKAFDCADHNKLWKILMRWECQTTLPASWEICMQVKKQQLELDMEQKTSSRLGKEYVKAVYFHLAYLTYMQNTSCEMLGWIKHKLESRLLAEISITSDMQITPSKWQKAKKN